MVTPYLALLMLTANTCRSAFAYHQMASLGMCLHSRYPMQAGMGCSEMSDSIHARCVTKDMQGVHKQGCLLPCECQGCQLKEIDSICRPLR